MKPRSLDLTKDELQLLIEVLDYYERGTLTARNAPVERGKIREKLVYALYGKF